ncbi:MoeB/ThiF family adenylyltransferase [Cytobacillus horneckiae]|uniref:Thiamine biosynthesis protein MoeB n=1 Tax=Cytobacillus horneckiae TaxID=549687 RepID=A0A2N0ZC72_9BACI|nr:MoeB/ThiF family adenylyltransferase [Cytobacillus horneckiae]MEC1155946.1 MoeB/ThiF family adenylyltransferase [Cytobacillus horneckiae]MED2939778.1 MoeB/ThiF family adenylyltransferase [Cytobacillus horneckiae]PKG27084.1 thiamine biosynthesis protein MoeB [Cytobacillus horneckiae]
MNNRYSRQVLFAPIGSAGQKKLMLKHVLIVGAGALGAANAEILARAGVGNLTIADRDYVEWSNLQRQQLYSEEDAMKRVPKAIAAANRINAINSEVKIHPVIIDVGVQELEELTIGIDLIIDATDNFDIRRIINDVAQKRDIPWIYGGCVGSYGLSFTVIPGVSPCLACLMEAFPLEGMTCDTVGVIQPAIQMVVSHQSSEALKILSEDLQSLRKTLVSFDLWKNHYSSIDVSSMKKQECLSCGINKTYPNLSYNQQTKAAILCGRDTVQIRPPEPKNMNLNHLAQMISGQGLKVEQNPFLLSVSMDNCRLVIFKDGRVLVHGVSDIAQAKSIYHRYLG